MTDAEGNIVWKAAYEPFGRAVVDPSSTVTNNFRFPGQYYDAESGLHYNWHRYYDPGRGRYMSPDPLGIEGGINLYTYTEHNPLNLIDPAGLVCGTWWNDWLVPDKPEGYDFTECCRKHDYCYAGKYNQCDKNKSQCDFEFYECMRRVCDQQSRDNKCYKYASIYWFAVEEWGNNAFEKARKKEPCKQCF